MIWPFEKQKAKLTFKEWVWLFLIVWWWMFKGIILLPYYIIRTVTGYK